MTDIERHARNGTENRQRQRRITFRLSEVERAELETKAERSGLTIGTYIRATILNAPTTRGVRKPPVEKVALAQVLGQLGRIGGNVHQIARHLNYGDFDVARDITSTLADITEMKAALMRALGKDAG